MSKVYLCKGCGKQANPPKGFSECECPHCGVITAVAVAAKLATDTEFSTKLTVKTDLFTKSYDGESIVDIYRDVSECIDERFNPIVSRIPEMPGFPGFADGKFTVTVTWEPDSE